MTYWRMQMHPAKPNEAVRHCVASLAAGYIGLDFFHNVGDLMTVQQSTLYGLRRLNLAAPVGFSGIRESTPSHRADGYPPGAPPSVGACFRRATSCRRDSDTAVLR